LEKQLLQEMLNPTMIMSSVVHNDGWTLRDCWVDLLVEEWRATLTWFVVPWNSSVARTPLSPTIASNWVETVLVQLPTS
jgi:hypothetical protein